MFQYFDYFRDVQSAILCGRRNFEALLSGFRPDFDHLWYVPASKKYVRIRPESHSKSGKQKIFEQNFWSSRVGAEENPSRPQNTKKTIRHKCQTPGTSEKIQAIVVPRHSPPSRLDTHIGIPVRIQFLGVKIKLDQGNPSGSQKLKDKWYLRLDPQIALYLHI